MINRMIVTRRKHAIVRFDSLEREKAQKRTFARLTKNLLGLALSTGLHVDAW